MMVEMRWPQNHAADMQMTASLFISSGFNPLVTVCAGHQGKYEAILHDGANI